LALLAVWLALPIRPAAAELVTSSPQVDANGVAWYEAVSTYNGPGSTTLRVLAPTNPAGVTPKFIYVLPVNPGVGLGDPLGDPLEALRLLDVHNAYNAHVIAPSFHSEPWYADHSTDPSRYYESFLVHDLVPWVQATLGATGHEEHWLIGQSKSGYGAVTLLFRNPTVFAAAAAWDFPAEQPDTGDWDMLGNYGSEENFQTNYRLTEAWIAAHADPFRGTPRLWLSHDSVTLLGTPTFLPEVDALAGRLAAQHVQFLRTGGVTREHAWTSGWLPDALAGLQGMRFTERDGFNRPDGGLGPRWTADPQFGTGASITTGQVSAPQFDGGAFVWDGAFGSDQFSQIRLMGTVGDWVGVSVRGRVSPGQGYWAAVKTDGVHLYAFVGGAFHELSHDASGWSRGDTLRLEVRTVAPGTARLTVYRNGLALLTYDDSAHFIADGQPGIGIHASVPGISLEDWRGGEVGGTNPFGYVTQAADDFNRADGGLGGNWIPDWTFGDEAAIIANQVTSSPTGGGALLWGGDAFLDDQYSQVRLTGPINEWAGVVVRGKVAASHGYWLAIKTDGARLYAFSNGVFQELVYNSTTWAIGDTVRLEVRTLRPGVARLTVYRNGSLLFAHDDTAYFIPTGQPGFGLFGSTTVDDWRGGELDVAGDQFDRSDGGLGLDWTRDETWGSGGSIAGQQVSSPHLTGGAFLWTATAFGEDQYSQLRLSGVIADWAGVAVRGHIGPTHGYWLAIKADGAHLYAVVNGTFHELAHDTTSWFSSDVVRLDARTIASGTTRLTVRRNGDVLFTHDESTHVIPGGQPGFGLWASDGVAVDDWEGGALPEQP
jgi:hypothetical protein